MLLANDSSGFFGRLHVQEPIVRAAQDRARRENGRARYLTATNLRPELQVPISAPHVSDGGDAVGKEREQIAPEVQVKVHVGQTGYEIHLAPAVDLPAAFWRRKPGVRLNSGNDSCVDLDGAVGKDAGGIHRNGVYVDEPCVTRVEGRVDWPQNCRGEG